MSTKHLPIRTFALTNMWRSRNFRQGGPGQSDKKALTFFFFFSVSSLFYRSQMVNFKEIYHLSRFRRGSNIFRGGSNFFQGGSNCLFPIETHITCNFPGGVRTPYPRPSGSALDKCQQNIPTSMGTFALTNAKKTYLLPMGIFALTNANKTYLFPMGNFALTNAKKTYLLTMGIFTLSNANKTYLLPMVIFALTNVNKTYLLPMGTILL